MKVTIFGTGYVGLVTGVCLAEIGHQVVCVDLDREKIATLQRRQSPIYEPGLDELLVKNIEAQLITFTTDAATGVQHGEYIFIAVGTPFAGDGSADLKYVYSVARDIGRNLSRSVLVVNKSTVPVGTGAKVKSIIQKELAKRDVNINFDIVSNPEFLKQGDAVKDFMYSDRIIIGTDDEAIFNRMCKLYEPLQTKIIPMDIKSAELSKYAANAFLATKISFINEIAQFAEKFGADIGKVREGLGSDARIGYNFLYAGCGYGGSCFPKDVNALIWMAREYGIETPLFNAVENINLRQKHLLFNKLSRYFGDLENRIIALWGLSFKPNTDDMREAPSRILIEALWRVGARIRAYDPVALGEAIKIYGDRGDLVLCSERDETLEGAEALVIVTEWDEFRQPDFQLIKNKLANPVIFDGRNILSSDIVRSHGIEYHGIGKL